MGYEDTIHLGYDMVPGNRTDAMLCAR